MTAPSHLFARLREPGSPAHVALLRVVLAGHLLWLLSSPSLSLLLAIGPTLHRQSHVVGGAAAFALLTPAVVTCARWVGQIAAVSFALGLGGRVTVGLLLACVLITQGFWFGATLFHDDWIYFVLPLLAFLVPTQPTAFSIDARLRRAPIDADARVRESRFVVEAWVAWIGLVYVAAGIAKLFPLSKGMGWLSGRAAQEFSIEFVRESPAVAWLGHTLFPYDEQWIFALASIGTVLVELGAMSLWLTRRAYLPMVVALFGLHATIWLLGIPGFVGMFGVAALAFLPKAAFRRFDAPQP